jgi:DNA-binding CsgD family transcriptional regulator
MTAHVFTQSSLSRRERQVALRIGRGARVSEIAADLRLSVKTVATYRQRILEKLGLRTTAQLMLLVLRHDAARTLQPGRRPLEVFLREWAS